MGSYQTEFAKYTRPVSRGAVPRQRLYDSLAKAREFSTVWVAGPPGSGKTTLVSEFLNQLQDRTIWYRLDPGDTDIATFFYYFSIAAQKELPGDALQLPKFTPQYLNDTTAFTRRYFRMLFMHLPTPFMIVIDNYQEVPARSTFHELILTALEQLPEGGCFILVSRSEPPSTLARLRANGQLSMLGWDSLRLNEDECRQIAEARGHALSTEVINQLYNRTQGWAAGLVLLLEHLRGDGRVAEMPQEHTPQVIFDYLAGEILKNYDQEIQSFLVRTALPSQITTKMAEHLADSQNVEGILGELSRRDYLITARDDQHGRVYEYHPLLREFLRSRAKASLSHAEYLALQIRTAEALEQTGSAEEAINVLLSARQWDAAVRLIDSNAKHLLRHGRGETLESWFDQLPSELFETNPWMLYWRAASQFRNTLRESRRGFIQAYRLFKNQQDPDLHGLFGSCIGIMNTIGYELDDLTLFDEWIVEIDELLKKYPDFPEQEYSSPLSAGMYLALYTRKPNHPEIEVWAGRLLHVAQTHPDADIRTHAVSYLITGIMWTGRFALSYELIESIRHSISKLNVPPMAEVILRNAEASYFMLSGDYDAGMRSVREGQKLADETGIHFWRNSTLLHGIGGALSANDLQTADELFDQLNLQEIRVRRYDAWQAVFAGAWRAYLDEDFLGAYKQLRKSVRLANELGVPFFEMMSHMWMAYVLFQNDDAIKGAHHLKLVRKMSASLKNHLFEFTSLLVYAAIALNHGRRSSGLRALRYALSLGREHEYKNMVWWLPSMMSSLMVTALEHEIEVEYVSWLIRNRGLAPEKISVHLTNWPWELRISSFGGFTMEQCTDVHCQPLALEGRPAELLKVLIAFGGRRININRIKDAMWPRIDADYAHRSFNTTLYRLRKILGNDQLLVLQGGKLSLNESLCWLDLWLFEQLVAELNAELHKASQWVERKKVLVSADQMLLVYRGAFLDQEDSDWSIGPSEQCKQKMVRSISDLVSFLMEDESWQLAAEYLERSLEVDFTIEHFYHQLMICYHRLDRDFKAVDVYKRAQAILRAHSDAPLSEDFQRAYRAICEGQ